MHPKKQKIIELLQCSAYSEISEMAVKDSRIISRLLSLTYDKKSVIAWRAIEMIGIACGEIAKTDTETVRSTVQKLLWMIRDESGGIGWSNPEILSEIVIRTPDLCADIAPIIISFHEEKMLIEGVMWAAGTMGKINSETVEYAVPLLREYLNHPTDTVKAYAARALGTMQDSVSLGALKAMTGNTTMVAYYSEGELNEKSIGEIAEEALQCIAA
ncbi:MAG: HEAT repeat domain-containing protein [Nitrospira sp.]|nr:HEAT repeat domain-containing protein [bacterium]MBL7048106.1 HEAT repeat domain-containing protein [Nitrospira sp.]